MVYGAQRHLAKTLAYLFRPVPDSYRSRTQKRAARQLHHGCPCKISDILASKSLE